MLRHHINIMLSLLLLLSPLPMFAKGTTERTDQATLTATDALDRTVNLSGQPQRVIIVGKSAIVAADAFLLFPEAVQAVVELPKTDQGTGDLYSLLLPQLADGPRTPELPSIEEVIARNPDLVLMKDFTYTGLGDKLTTMGIPVFTISLEMPEDWQTELVQLGKLVGDSGRAEEVLGLYKERQDCVAEAVATVPMDDRPRILMMRVSSTDGPLTYTVAPDTWMQTRFVEDAGGIPVWMGSGFANKGFAKISFEQIAAWDPDYIYIYSYKDPADEFLTQLKNDRRWADIPAMKAGRVKAIPGDFSSYAQPISRWILCLQWLAADLYPQLFPGFDMEREITTFYEDFHGLQDQAALDELLELYRNSIQAN